MVKEGEAITLVDDPSIKCSKTGKKADIKFYNFYYSKNVYLNLIKSRIKKQLLGRLNRNKKIYVKGDLAMYYTKKLYPNFSYEKIYDISDDKHGMVVLEWTLDDEINHLWNSLNNKSSNKPNFDFIPLFVNVQDKELLIISKWLNIPFIPNKKKYIFDGLDNKFYGIKTTILKNSIQFNNLSVNK